MPENRDPRPFVAVGAAALFIGFAAGFVAGTERVRQGSAPFAPSQTAMPAQHVHTGAAAGGMPEPPRGHTFTGKVDVPPHGELGHELASRILGEVQCPCGGCSDMTLLECTCDLAKEAEGLAAHLFERGKNGAQVLAQLGGRYGFEVPASVLARVESVGAPHGSSGASAAPEPRVGGGSLLDLPIERPRDIPTSARPKP